MEQHLNAPRIGVDLGGTKIEAVVLNGATNEIVWRQRIATPSGDYTATIDAVRSLVAAAESELSIGPCCVGVGTPGSLNADGTIKNANSTCLNGQPLAADLSRVLNRPVRIANDANCLALSEASDGAGAGERVVFAVILGTGVGAGIVVDGRLLTGPNGLAGEWGHNPLPWADDTEGTFGVNPSAARCYCGQRGCIETWLSGPGLARDHETHTGSALAGPAIVERAASGDAQCEQTMRRYESRLARALASVVNLLDPDVIVLGGGLSRVQRLYDNVPTLWHQHVFGTGATHSPRTKLRQSLHGDSSGVRGAAWLWP